MQTEVIISGFGGQGTLYAGQVLAYAAMDEGKQVTWIPSYGPEMRGGTANCTVVVSDEEIGSPTVKHPKAVLALNLPSLDKYENMIAPGGCLVVNESMVNRKPERTDIRVVLLPANEIAREIGNERATNMVMLGALLANMDILPIEALEKALKNHTAQRLQKFVEMNIQALRRGAEYRANL
ncbi:MAG TPA: 2-oxoacid:acceptor oxidoreductase family protein [Anaerolineaceae bacterium]|jgi:2-oxoglutarate ferredoxin oxidoreductase subunit gamma|nr:2-oxoacid:acceptor oxidoreductase family protein [Anaerolineaceae bacterium]HOV31576.1 2-oxoacid:acceptor oxidoreductase family protein [Anaerolineaceae bacterium]